MENKRVEEVRKEIEILKKTKSISMKRYIKLGRRIHSMQADIDVLNKEYDNLQTSVIATTLGPSDDLDDLIISMLQDGKLLYFKLLHGYVKLVNGNHPILCKGYNGVNGFNPYGGKKYAMMSIRHHKHSNEDYEFCITKHADKEEYHIDRMNSTYGTLVNPEDY